MEIIEYLECQCECPTHMIRLIKDDEYNERSIIFFLNKYKSFWKRVRLAFAYIFDFGDIDFDSYLLKEEDKEKFKRWLE